VLAQAADGEGAIVAELDLERQAAIRASLPSLANRRPESYAWPREHGAEQDDESRRAREQHA
jgi:predicted amidohydrolase